MRLELKRVKMLMFLAPTPYSLHFRPKLTGRVFGFIASVLKSTCFCATVLHGVRLDTRKAIIQDS